MLGYLAVCNKMCDVMNRESRLEWARLIYSKGFVYPKVDVKVWNIEGVYYGPDHTRVIFECLAEKDGKFFIVRDCYYLGLGEPIEESEESFDKQVQMYLDHLVLDDGYKDHWFTKEELTLV